MSWQLQEAKARFSELVQKAIEQGPQIVTRRGKDAVVILSIEEYRKLAPKRENLMMFLASMPEEIQIESWPERPGDIDL